jgi:hypothetical protein
MNESNDEAVLRMLGGANFGPDAKLILPSGRTLDGDEAQALTSYYGPAEVVGAERAAGEHSVTRPTPTAERFVIHRSVHGGFDDEDVATCARLMPALWRHEVIEQGGRPLGEPEVTRAANPYYGGPIIGSDGQLVRDEVGEVLTDPVKWVFRAVGPAERGVEVTGEDAR